MKGAPSSSHVVDLDHVRVVEQRADARLVAKHLHHPRVAGQLRLEPLDHQLLLEPAAGPVAVDLPLAGEIDLRHSADRQKTGGRVPPRQRVALGESAHGSVDRHHG